MPAIAAGAVKGWTIERMDLLQERVAAGVDEATIAAELDMPERIVNLKRLALGLYYASKGAKSLVKPARAIPEATQTETPTMAPPPPVEVRQTPTFASFPTARHSANRATLAGVKGNQRHRPPPTMPAAPRPASPNPGPIAKAWADEKAKTEEPTPMPVSQATREKLSAAMTASHARRKAEIKPGDLIVKAANGIVTTEIAQAPRLPEHGGEPTDDDMVKVDYWMRREAEKGQQIDRALRELRALQKELRLILDGNQLFTAWCKVNDAIAIMALTT